jgi:hypothetical protein
MAIFGDLSTGSKVTTDNFSCFFQPAFDLLSRAPTYVSFSRARSYQNQLFIGGLCRWMRRPNGTLRSTRRSLFNLPTRIKLIPTEGRFDVSGDKTYGACSQGQHRQAQRNFMNVNLQMANLCYNVISYVENCTKFHLLLSCSTVNTCSHLYAFV